jgi:hypothetical protein
VAQAEIGSSTRKMIPCFLSRTPKKRMRPLRSFNGSGNRISAHMPTSNRPAARGQRAHTG